MHSLASAGLCLALSARLTDHLAEQLFRPVSAARVLLLDVAEKLRGILIARSLGVLNILINRLRRLKRVVENADDVVLNVSRSGVALTLLIVCHDLWSPFVRASYWFKGKSLYSLEMIVETLCENGQA